MAAITSAGPNFFNLQDDSGNTLVYTGGGMCELLKLDWSLGRWTDLFIVPSSASNIMSSAYMFAYPGISTTSFYRGYFGQDPGNKDPLSVGWVTNAENVANTPGTAIAATQVVTAHGCGYYVKQGSLFLQKPNSKKIVMYGTKPVVWNINPTTGQAFLLKNPADGSYVTINGTAISSTKSQTAATVFEFVNGYIVVYNTYTSSASTVTIVDQNVFAVTQSQPAASLAVPAGSAYNVLTPGVLTNGKNYLGMPTASATAFIQTTDASKGLVPVQPPASMVSPSLLFIYAFGVGAGVNYANPTPYTTFIPSRNCKKSLSTGAIVGIAAGAVALVAIVAGLVYAYQHRTKK